MKQEFVQEGMRTYLKIEGDDLENVGDKMFSYQTIPGFVPMEIEWVDEKKQYVYDVTGKLNLKQYLEKDGIGKHKVKKVMECLLSLPERLESYLLDGNDVRILPDNICHTLLTNVYPQKYKPAVSSQHFHPVNMTITVPAGITNIT